MMWFYFGRVAEEATAYGFVGLLHLKATWNERVGGERKIRVLKPYR